MLGDNSEAKRAQPGATTSGNDTDEVVLATSAGFTEQVDGCSLELDDLEKAYNKVMKDWNITSHTGY